MALPRWWYSSSLLLFLIITLSVWACGDSGGPTEPTPTQQEPVASVTVAPSAAEVEVSETHQFTATVKDAGGNTLTGRTVTWSSSDQNVATVSQSGLVTALEAGQATITATSEGRSGTAGITVNQSLPAGVLAVGTIGADGGSIEATGMGLSIAAGQLSATTEIQILDSDDPMAEFGSDLVSGAFRLEGFPEDRVVEVRVRLKTTAPLREQTFIGMGVPIIRSSMDTMEEQRGLVLREATDSSGYLVATLPVRGRSASSESAPSRALAAEGTEGLSDGLIAGVTGVKADTASGGRWVILSWGAPRAELDPMVTQAASLLESSQDALEGMGYGVDHRTQWPMEVRVYPTDEFSGAFCRELPWPLDVNKARFEFSTSAMSRADMPGTAIHEFFHFAQSYFTDGMSDVEEYANLWINEASSTWVEEKAPDLGGFSWLVESQRDDLFRGLNPSLSADDGYGKAPLIKYIETRWGTDQIEKIWANVKSGKPAVDAVLQAIPETPATWWPDLLTKYMKGELYTLDPDSLPPPSSGEIIPLPGNVTWGSGVDVNTLGAEFVRISPTQNGYGTATKLTLRLPPELHTAGFRVLPFRKDESGKWESAGGVVDSLVISGADLNLGRQYGIYMIPTVATSPYTESWDPSYETDIGYQDGDWYAENVEVLTENITYTRPSASDTTTVDIAGDTEVIFNFLASGGIWKRMPDEPNRYIWEATPDFQNDLTEMNSTAWSEARVIPGDTLHLTAGFDFNPPASGVGESGNPFTLAGLGLLLLAGLVVRRSRQVAMVASVGAFGLVLWGCDIGTINFSLKYRYDFTLTNPALMASLTDPQVPMVKLVNGTGTVYLDRYLSEFWEYTRDAEGNKTDSVAVTRTASGEATVKLDASLVQDGAFDEEESVEAMLRASGLLQGPVSALPEAIRKRIWR